MTPTAKEVKWVCMVCLIEIDPQTSDVTHCPSCKTKSPPMVKGDDVTITINIQQARLLTMWAARWATDKVYDTSPDSVIALANAVEIFRVLRPDVEWTLGDALKMLRDKFGKVDITGKEPML